MFKFRFMLVLIVGFSGGALLPGANPAHACTGSANDPPHCINVNQAINAFRNFFFGNLQVPPGCQAGLPCGGGGADLPFYGPVVTSVNNPYSALTGGTEITITGQNFNDPWFDTPGTTCTFGDCSGGTGAVLFGGGPNSGYLCDAGGPGCGSDGFVPRQGLDFTSAGNFNNPFRTNLTSGAIDPFGGATDDSYTNPRTGEQVTFDPANPPPEVKKAQELLSAYANGEIAYPFFEDWENRPIEDFSLDNPNGVGGVPADRQPGAGLAGLQNTTPLFAAPQPVTLPEIPAGLINTHPYQRNATSGAFDPFGGGEGIFVNPQTGIAETFDPANPPDHVQKAQELNQAYMDGKINYPFYTEGWQDKSTNDFDPNGGDLGGAPGFGPIIVPAGTAPFVPVTPVSPDGTSAVTVVEIKLDDDEDGFDDFLKQTFMERLQSSGGNVAEALESGTKYNNNIVDALVSGLASAFGRSPEETDRLRRENRPDARFGTIEVQHYRIETPAENSNNDALRVEINRPAGTTSTPTGAAPTPGVPARPAGEKVGELAYNSGGNQQLVEVIKTPDGRTLAVGTGENAGHVYGEAKEGEWGYRREGPWKPPPPKTDPAPTSSRSPDQRDSRIERTRIDDFKTGTPNFYIHVSIANSDRDAMTPPTFADGFESGNTAAWTSTGAP